MITDTQHTCPICNSESKYIFTTKHTREVFHCSNDKCSHFFTPILDHRQGVCDRLEDIQKESDESLKIFDDRNFRFLDLLKTYLSAATKPYRLLDFGAGNAHISRTFNRELQDDCVIYCLEPNPLCSGFYSKYNINQVKRIDDIPELIDLIYMIEVIEHLTDPISVLNSLRSKLKPDGMIFLSTPGGAEKESLTNAYDMASHVHFFTAKSLNLTLQKSGFSEIHYQYYPQMYPHPPKSNILRRNVRRTKLIIKSNLIKTGLQTRIGHLVGLTKPIQYT